MTKGNPLSERYRREAPVDADVVIHPSDRAWRGIEKLQRTDPARARVLWSSLEKLYYLRNWSPGNPNSSLRICTVGKDAQDYTVYKFRGDHKHIRGFFRLVRDSELSDLPIVLIDDLSTAHDDEMTTLRAVLNRQVTEEQLLALESDVTVAVEPDERKSGPMPGRPGMRYHQLLNVPYEEIDSAITWASSAANIVPTQEQIESIWAPAPVLINGQAGTGKTSMLAIRAAWVIRNVREAGTTARFLCTAYSRPVVELLRANVNDAILYKMRQGATPEQDGVCEFITFPDVLLRLLDEKQRQVYLDRENRVTFGRFNREFFQREKRYGRVGDGVNAEFVWYAIRCFLKGYGEDRPLTIADFSSVGKEGLIPKKLTQELTRGELEESIRIFSRYTKWLSEKGLFDDIDLARSAWLKVRDKPPQRYDEIYLDEAQDLTRVEFKVLESLLSPESEIPSTGFRMALAGDPLQTIHPTGFNWARIRALLYQGEDIRQTDLKINQRTPQPIVDLANAIQRRRTHYGLESLVEQDAREQSGRLPACYQVDSPKDDDAIVSLLKSPLPNTALIIWAEDVQDILEFLREDPHVNRVARDLLGDSLVEGIIAGVDDDQHLDTLLASMKLFTVSSIKGQEFARVIFYKLAAHSQFQKFASETIADLPVGEEFHSRIPILYHLNRLYVATTRSTQHLFILDTTVAVENVWSRFQEIDLSRRYQLASLLDDPALAPDDKLDWVQDAKRYLNIFREEQDARWLAYAKDCLNRARDNADAKALLIEVNAETKEQEAAKASRKGLPTAVQLWREAGNLWDQSPMFYQKAAKCYVSAESWLDLRRVLGVSTKRTSEHEGWYLYAEMQVGRKEGTQVAAETYLDFLDRNRKLPVKEEWTDYLSSQLKRFKLAPGLLKLHDEILWSGNRSELKHPQQLAQALFDLGELLELVRFIDRRNLHRQLPKFYSDANLKLALVSEAQGRWNEAARYWKALAEHEVEEKETVKAYVSAGDAFAKAAIAGASGDWSEAAHCYEEAGPDFARQRAIAEAEAVSRVGNILSGIKTLSSAIAKGWIVEGPLRERYDNRQVSERLVEWAKVAPLPSLASDQDALSSVATAYLHLGRREDLKEHLKRLLPHASGNHKMAIHRRIGGMEEEDRNIVSAVTHFEEANDYEKAWALARHQRESFDPQDLVRLEGRFLSQQYKRQREPYREDADRAILLLTEVGDITIVKELEELRLSREKELSAKVRLLLSKTVNLDSLISAINVVNSTTADPQTLEARLILIKELVNKPQLVQQGLIQMRASLGAWTRDPTFVLPARKELSPQQWGTVVEAAQDDLASKEYFRMFSSEHDWARDGFRRAMSRMRQEFMERARTDDKQMEFVRSLDRELADAEASWTEGRSVALAKSQTEIQLMRTKLASETVPELRERWKKSGIPGSSVATKELLIEGYLAYWLEKGNESV